MLNSLSNSDSSQIPNADPLNAMNLELQQLLNTRDRQLEAVISGARITLDKTTFSSTARPIFDECSRLLGTTSGYVALLSADGSENDVFFLEDGGMECTVDPNLPMPTRGLREHAYIGNCVVYDNDFMLSEWVRMMPSGHMDLQNVLFAPLRYR